MAYGGDKRAIFSRLGRVLYSTLCGWGGFGQAQRSSSRNAAVTRCNVLVWLDT
jgi:hypothetical protein